MATVPPQPITHSRSKTLGILALVFGIIALAFSPIPILNNVGAIIGGAAIIIGIIGLWKSSRGMSVAGAICGVIGIAITLVLQAQWSTQLDKIGDDLKNMPVPTATQPR